jgi:DNA-binding response OmpR family regulator
MTEVTPSSRALARVLVIDDQRDTVDLVTAVLSDAGYQVTGAMSGGDGLMVLDVEQPDVVILDLQMPGVSGVEVLCQIRRERPGLPVIIFSAQVDIAVARTTLSLGAIDYIPKPFDPEHMLRSVGAALTHGRSSGPALTA